MAARRRYATVPEQMVFLAREARQEGLTFAEWWDRAVRPGLPPVLVTKPDDWMAKTVLWPSDSSDRNEWRDATMGALEGWRRAYEGIPATTNEKALMILEPLLGSIALSAPLPVKRVPAAA